MKTLRNLSLSAAALVLASTSAFAQQAAPASVHGTINNAAGQPVKEGVVKLSTDRAGQDDKTRKYQYTGQVGADGTYKIDNVAPGDYVLFYQVNDKTIDYLAQFFPDALKVVGDADVDTSVVEKNILSNEVAVRS